MQLITFLSQALESPLQEVIIKFINDQPDVLFFEVATCVRVIEELVIKIANFGVFLSILAFEVLGCSHHCNFESFNALGRKCKCCGKIILIICLTCLFVDVQEIDE